MVRPERTNFRDQEYSNWHRTIGEGFSMYDIDSVEVRWGRGIVAILELKKSGGELKKDQGIVYLEIARALKVPYYLTRYYEGMTKIIVYKYDDDGASFNETNFKIIKTNGYFSVDEYAEFLRTL